MIRIVRRYYDLLHIYQLTEADYPDGTTYTYTYDEAGNRTQDKDRTYTYNNLNQLISASDGTTYTYDGDGNLIEKTTNTGTTQYTWNRDNKLTKVVLPSGDVIEYRYDAEGMRVKKVEDGSEVRYLMDGLSGQIHTESGSLNQPYQYVGGEGYYTEQEIGLKLLEQRWYDGGVGRFISRDLMFDVNLFIYTRDNPINTIDPTGEYAYPFICAVPKFHPVCIFITGIIICCCRPNHHFLGCYLRLLETIGYIEFSIGLDGKCVKLLIPEKECSYDCYNLAERYYKEKIVHFLGFCSF